MRCRDVWELESAYMDGELDEDRASAFRGHLRVCEVCRERVDRLAVLVETAARLEPVEPPPSLWSAIERGLAQAEIADAQRSWLWLRWQAIRPRLLPAAVACAAASVLVLWVVRRGQEPGPARADGPAPVQAGAQAATMPEGEAATMVPDVVETFEDARGRELAQAEQRYRATIDELRRMVEAELSEWPDELRAAYEARLGEFDMAAERHRQALAASQAVDLRGRDALHAVYRAQIAFLQRAAIDGPMLAQLDARGRGDVLPGGSSGGFQ